MRFLACILGVAAAVRAQDTTATTATTSATDSSSVVATSSSSSSPATSTSSTTSVTSPSSTPAPTASNVIVVGPSGPFTAINAAVGAAQNSAIPTVSILAGTYSESIVIQGTQTVTLVGPSASNVAGNQVVIAAAATAGVVSFNTQKSLGVTFRNINITNTITVAGNKAAAVSLVGSNMGFYNVALVSGGLGAYTSSLGYSILSGCYIEGPDKLFYNYVNAYVFNSVIVPTANSASIFYAQGYQQGGTWYNSSIVVDSSFVQQKPGLTNSYVYLATPNANYTEAIFRGTSLGSLIAPSGVRTTVCSYAAVYGEFANTGAGAMTTANAATRNAACDQSLTASQLSGYSVDQLFGHGFPGDSSFDTTWIDSSVLQAIQSADAAQVGSAPIVSVSSSTLSSTTSSASSTASTSLSTATTSSTATTDTTGTTTSGTATSTGTSSTDATSSGTSSTTSITSLSSSTSSTAASVLTVATASAQFSDIGAAVTAAQNSAIASITVLPGTYSAFVVPGTQVVTISGPAATAVSDNQVVITSSGTGTITFGTSNGKGLTLRNLNITNTATTGGVGSAINAKGMNVQILTCALVSSAQGVYQSSYGITLIANSFISGTDKLFYNYPTVYVYGSIIQPLTSGSSIFYGKGATIGGVNFNATLVVDSSSVLGSVSNVYLATPNGVASYLSVIYRGTALGSLIAPGGVYSTGCSVIATFGEFGTTGAGAYSNNAANRGAATCDYQLSADQVSAFTIDKVFANAFAGYSSTDMSWIDPTVLALIQSSDSAQVSSASTISTATPTSSASSTSGSASVTCATPTPSATLAVSQNATGCQYSTIASAIAAVPNDNQPYTIFVAAGVYNEQISITRNGKVTLMGETGAASDYSQNKVKVQFSKGVLTSAGQNELTPVLNVKKTGSLPDFAVYNIDFINLYPQTPNSTALAVDVYANNFAAYGCSFVGYQDTLLANKGIQIFSHCYVEGSIDFVWGFSTAYFYRSVIASNTKGACIAAQGRVAGTTTSYVFDECKVTYTSTYGTTMGATFLGRPYSSFSTVVYKNSYLDQHIAAAGWQQWSTSAPQTSNVTFGEYNNTGPGSGVSSRVSFATAMTADQITPFSLANVVGDTTFIDQTAWNYPAPFNATATAPTGTSPISTGPTTTSTVNAHPDSGTVAPPFAVLVSPNGQVNGSYANLTSALASLPSDNTNQTIFLYSGSYTEQVPSINRPGAVRIIGYTTGNPGQAYQNSTVTIQYARGLTLSPLPAGHNDAETATISTASNNIAFYNIIFINTDNIDGAEANYVTLAGSTYGSHISFYGCSFDGWQDTLLTGSTNGYQYFESCYIGGAIDFIWGYSKAYFKGCTIGAKRASSAITAQSRASSSSIGGYIFDQCYFGASPKATVDLSGKVFLGRPYSAFALVVVKNSYLDTAISPTGWKVWSVTDPRTSNIMFGEYNNVGPSRWETNSAARLAFGNATLLTSDTYPLASVMDSTSWIDMTYFNSIVTPGPTAPPPPGNITVGGSSVYNGTTPPAGALIVSQSPIAGQTVYSTIQSALNAAPISSKQNATIFIYPGTYNEKLIVNKSGSTIFMGYSSATDDYAKNQVTIQQSYGEDTQGTGSDVDTATVYATGNNFYAYNVNFRNNNGTQQNIASLGFAVKSSKFAFMHACQIYGNQDTLYISGSIFTHKTYIEGNIDFIFGSGSGYFLNSTIGVNEEGDSITAHKRTTNTSNTAFVFDQSRIVPAVGVAASTWRNVSLGRPWNNLARVAYIDSYLDGMIGKAGWDQWSKSTPNTDAVTYGEYHNYGPGSGICGRVPFSKQFSDVEVVQFQLQNLFLSTSWIDFSVVDSQPFVPGIGSAPAPCGVTSTSSIVSSTVLSTSSTSSIVSTTSSTLPIVTVYTTKYTTDKEIAYTTITVGDVTSTSVVRTTEVDTESTAAPVLRTSTVKATTIVSSTVTEAASTVTIRSTETDVSTTTIKGNAQTVKSTAYVTTTSTYYPKATTVKATTTVYVVSTFTPKPSTVTNQEGTVSTVYKTSTPKGSTITSTISLSGAQLVKTTTVKGSTTTVSTTSLKTTTKKTKITCAPTVGARLFRRGLEVRAAGTVTSTVFATVTAFTKTSTVSQGGSTVYATVTSVVTVYSTPKPTTSTVFTTSYKTSTEVFTNRGNVATVTQISTKVVESTITAPVSTITSLVTSTSTITETQAATTSTSYKIISSTSTTSLPANTVTVVNSANSYVTSVTTLQASTSTVFKTSSGQASTSTVTVQGALVTKTTTVKSTMTVFQTSTKSSSGAPACTG
ncbi:hypothetical protein B0A48_08281 [Cryoendolithus antarcticus]|uniref:pectinesterase n=1 Tax=Cryoendolithus antarcticus TaxID=1507870 RepID=A0A1V8T5J0_9PEZI|nr:hypothetical protein B0A48_08281 [Cryoendolithus antarcticus]